MLATDRYLDHLLETLNDSGDPADFIALYDNNLKAFFDKIAEDRIRIGPTGWQGYRVSGLLWNLPDLRAAGKAALSRHIRNRWQNFAKSEVSQDPAPQAAVKNPHETQHTGSLAADESVKKEAVELSSNTPPETLQFHTGSIRRDWFDHLTDWVAALITLWK